jgi:hypothetical protein
VRFGRALKGAKWDLSSTEFEDGHGHEYEHEYEHEHEHETSTSTSTSTRALTVINETGC